MLNLAGNAGMSIVVVLVTFVTTPLLLQFLGPERFGAFRTMRDWMGYLMLLELGLGGALLAKLAQALAVGDAIEVDGLLTAGGRSYAALALVMFAVGASMTPILPSLIRAERIPAAEIRVAWIILVTTVILVPGGALKALLMAEQRSYVLSALTAAESLLMLTLGLAFGWLGWMLWGQSMSILVAQAVSVGALVLFARHRSLRSWLRRSARARYLRLWSLNWPMFVHNITLRVGLMSDTIVLSWIVGPSAVTTFYLTQRLAALAQGQLLGLGQATWAGLAELHGQGEYELFRARVLELTRLTSCASLIALIPITAYNHRILSLWVGDANYGGSFLNFLTAFNTWAWSVSALWGWTLVGTGVIGRWMPFGVSFMVVNLCASIALTLTYGMVGPAAGSAVSFIVVNSWALPIVLQRAFGVSARELIGEALRPFIWGIPYGTFLWKMAASQPEASWLSIGIQVTGSVIGGTALAWVLTLDQEDRRAWAFRFGLLARTSV